MLVMIPSTPAEAIRDEVVAQPHKLDVVVVKVELLFVQAALVVVQQAKDEWILVQLTKVGIWRIANYDREALIPV